MGDDTYDDGCNLSSSFHQSLCIWFAKADLEGRLVKEDLPSSVRLRHFRLTSTIIIIIVFDEDGGGRP